ncbi:MAG TPA: DNA topoisomerase IB [Thermoanaerobaculia bacterium]|jgi:DNA topoisomerase-1|nr:DNA topoisomerase IB [Thermoanaerobaculia bacterium]
MSAAATAVALPPPADDPAATAADAGLRYVSDDKPGITRRRRGKGFSYRDADGKPLRDAETLQRIRSLAIPPAWTDVWICPNPKGHIQATGRDARGRKQYRYHPRWREVRDATKFSRMVEFGEALPALRRRIRRDLLRTGLPREKVLATVVRLLETTCIRVGNDEYTKSNGTFGLTTLRNHHVAVRGEKLFFRLRAKGGKRQEARLSDRSVAKVVRECQEIPGYELFQYRDGDGEPQPIDSADVNDYLREVAGRNFTAKDFRTWMGSVHALARLREVCAGEVKATKARLLEVLDYVAGQLSNTRAVTRKFYVHPGLQQEYLEGRLIARLARLREPRPVPGLSSDETVLLALLRTLG